jgi:hypothetical protein
MASARSPNDIIALINGNEGLAVQNRFRVIANLPAGVSGDIKSLDLMCDSAAFPAKRLMTAAGPDVKRTSFYAYSMGTEEIPFVFLLDNKYSIKQIFDEWVEMAINEQTFSLTKYRDELVTDWEVYQQDGQNEDIYGIKLIDVMPVQVGQIDLSNEGSGTIQKLNVSVVYKRKEKIL